MRREAITPALVGGLVAAQFPQWADLPVRPVELDGWDNATFRLGADLSVRMPTAEMYAPQLDKEHRWLPVLAPRLPLPIPEPLAIGEPGLGYPWRWSVYRWLPGRHATVDRVGDLTGFATDLAGFLRELREADATGGPPPGPHNFFRGGPVAVYDGETRAAIAALGDVVDRSAALEVWDVALATAWSDAPCWVHGDVTASNLLVVDGRLAGVVDFGCAAVGDPACDLTIAWTFFAGASRTAFREACTLDAATWARARGWALWKALVTLRNARRSAPAGSVPAEARFGWRPPAAAVAREVLADVGARN